MSMGKKLMIRRKSDSVMREESKKSSLLKRLTFTIAFMFLVACVSKNNPYEHGRLPVPVGKLSHRLGCIDLSKKGVSKDRVSNDAISAAINDALGYGKKIRFYKSLQTSITNTFYYTFFIDGTSDLYLVYVVNEDITVLEERFFFGSLHYSKDPNNCPT